MKTIVSALLFFLLNAAHAQMRIVPQTGHIGWCKMEISPDGKRMVSAGPEGKLIFWDIKSYKAIWQEYAHKNVINHIEWRFDNRHFLSASDDSTLCVWDSESMQKVRTYHHFNRITSAAFNPKADLLVYGDDQGNILMYHLVKNEEILRIKVGSSVQSLTWADNGFVLFCGSEKNGVQAFEMDSGKKILDMEIKGGVSELQLTPGNKLLLIHTLDGLTEVWEPLTGKGYGSMENAIAQDINGNTAWSRPCASYNGKFIFMFDKDKKLQIGRLDPVLTHFYDLQLLESDIRMIKASPANNFIVLTDMSGGIWICFFTENDFSEGNRLYWHKLCFEPERIRQISFRDNDEALAMKGSYQYEFNFSNGDLTRREDDSSVVENTTATLRYFSPSRLKDGIYYYVNTTRDIMYKVKDQEYMEQIPMYAHSADTSVIAYVDNNQLNFYDVKKAAFVKQEKIASAKDFVLFNGHLNNYFVVKDKKGLRFIHCNSNEEKNIKLNGKESLAWISAPRDNRVIYACDTKGKFFAWNFSTGQELKINGDLARIRVAQFEVNSTNTSMIAFTQDQRLLRINPATGAIEAEWKEKIPPALAVSINEKGDRFALADLDGVVRVFDMGLSRNYINIIPSPANGLIAYTPDNDYIATKEAAQNLALVNGKNVLGFEQIDLRHNRPDKVLSNIGLAEPELIAAYERAWKKRMERSGLLENSGNEIPEVELANMKDIPLTTEKDGVDLHIKAKSIKGIHAIKVWVEGVPLNGREGVLVKDSKSETELKLKAPLVYGTNTVEIASVSKDGIESEKIEFQIVNKKPAASELFIVSIGVSQYKDAAWNLDYAHKDATDLVSIMKNTGAFSKVNARILTNEMATREKIIQTKEFIKQSKPNDVVILFIAGHGVRDAKLDYYFATHDIDFNDPSKRGLSDTEIENMMDGIGSLRKLLLFDTCLSGDIDKEDVEKGSTENVVVENVNFRSAGTPLKNKNPLGVKNAQFLMKEIFNDVKRGTGATIISSAAGVQVAAERKDFQNGLFTYCLLSGLKNKLADRDKDGEISLHELQAYVKKEVNLLSLGKQMPDFKSANKEQNFRLW